MLDINNVDIHGNLFKILVDLKKELLLQGYAVEKLEIRNTIKDRQCEQRFGMILGIETEEKVYNKGQKVLVSDQLEGDYQEGIYISTIQGSEFPYICVGMNNDDRQAFYAKKTFRCGLWKYIKPLPEVEEMTIEEIQEQLGKKIKIVEKK